MTHVVLVEVYWVLRRAYRFSAQEVLDAFSRLLGARNLMVEDHGRVAAAIRAAKTGADFADTLIDGVSRKRGCDEIVTFDVTAAESLGWTDLNRGDDPD